MVLDARDLLESLDREIAYYRGRLSWLFTYSLAVQLVVASGSVSISFSMPWVRRTVYSTFFVAIAIFATLIRNSYVARVYMVRKARKELVEAAGYPDPYVGPGGHVTKTKRVLSPSKIYLLTLWSLSALGILIAWLGGSIRSPG